VLLASLKPQFAVSNILRMIIIFQVKRIKTKSTPTPAKATLANFKLLFSFVLLEREKSEESPFPYRERI